MNASVPEMKPFVPQCKIINHSTNYRIESYSAINMTDLENFKFYSYTNQCLKLFVICTY